METKKQDVSALLKYDHRMVTSRAEAIGLWLGNTFCFSLLTQGPFCAGILLHVRPTSLQPSAPHSDARHCGAGGCMAYESVLIR